MANIDDEWEDEASSDWVDETPAEDPEAVATRLAEQHYDVNKPGMLESARTGFLQGVTKNFAPRITAGIETAFGSGSYDENLLRATHKMAREERENPVAYGASDLAGTIATAPAVASPLGAAAWGFGEGSARTLGSSSKINGNALMEAGKRGTQDALFGAMLTKYAPAVMNAAGKVTKPMVAKLDDMAGRYAVRALGRATPTQTKNMEGRGILPDVGQWAIKNKIISPLASNKKMLDRTENVLQNVADEMKPLYEQAKNNKISADKLMAFVKRRAKTHGKEPGGVPLSNQLMAFHAEIKAAADNGRKSYTPSELKVFRQKVQDRLNYNSEPIAQEGGRRFRNIIRGKEMGLVGKGNPEAREANEKLFRSIHLGSNARDIAERGAAQSQTNNKLGLTSYVLGGGIAGGAMKYFDPVVAGMVGGGAVLGRELVRRYGDQWTALTANRIARAADSETYKPLFEAAAKKGGAAVASLHDQLMNSDPSYSGMFEQEKNMSASTPESKLRAAGLATTNNLLFGADDEVSGFAGAVGAGLRGEDPKKAYYSQRDEYRNAKKAAGLRDPASYYGADIGMSMLTPALGAAGKGATELQRALSGARAGALIGGLSGAGNAEELEDVPESAFASALMGGSLGAAGASLGSKGRSDVWESGVPRNPNSRIEPPKIEPTMQRTIERNGEKLTHQVYVSDAGHATHYLIDGTGEPVAKISGKVGDTIKGAGIKTGWSQAKGGKGYGKTLYDLVLDTHGNLISDDQLSKKGSHKIYTDHLAKQPGVDARLASWGNPDPHKIYLDDPVKFHEKNKFPPFEPRFSGVKAKLEEMATGKKPEGYRKDLVEPRLPSFADIVSRGTDDLPARPEVQMRWDANSNRYIEVPSRPSYAEEVARARADVRQSINRESAEFSNQPSTANPNALSEWIRDGYKSGRSRSTLDKLLRDAGYDNHIINHMLSSHEHYKPVRDWRSDMQRPVDDGLAAQTRADRERLLSNLKLRQDPVEPITVSVTPGKDQWAEFMRSSESRPIMNWVQDQLEDGRDIERVREYMLKAGYDKSLTDMILQTFM